MIHPGLFPIIQMSNLKSHSVFQVIECLLDHNVRQFLYRSRGIKDDNYAAHVQEIDLLQDNLDFDYYLHRHVELINTTHAKGVHLTQESPELSTVRGQLGHAIQLGYSAHSLDEALQAEDAGADYVFLGSIFETPKQNPHPILGTKVLAETCRKLTIPVVAIGGIDADNLAQVKDAGAYGFSALRALYDSGDLDHAIAKLTWLWDDL